MLKLLATFSKSAPRPPLQPRAPQAEYQDTAAVLAGCRAALLVLDGQCRVLCRLQALFETWTAISLAAESKAKEPVLEVGRGNKRITYNSIFGQSPRPRSRCSR